MGGKNRGRQGTKMTTEETDYAVERIVDDRIIKGKVQYKVHWEGYGTDEETWENESELNCPELLEEYIANTQNNEEESSAPSSARKEKTKSSRAKKSGKSEASTDEENEITPSTSADAAADVSYEVERIMDDRILNGKLQYKVHWVGYSTDEETWEDNSNLDCPDLIKKYEKSKNDKTEKKSELRKQPPKKKQKREDKEESKEPENYEVEKVMDDRILNGKLQYKIHWVGYSTDEETWEDSSNLNCPDLIKEYENSKNDKSEKKSDQKKTPKSKQRREEDSSNAPDNFESKNDKADQKSEQKKPTNKKKQESGSADEDENSMATEEYEVERILEMHTLKNGNREFLVKWVGYSKEESTWEPERNLEGTDLLKQFLLKVEKAKELTTKELRVNRQPTDRFTATPQGDKRRQSKRYANKQRVKYYDAE